MSRSIADRDRTSWIHRVTKGPSFGAMNFDEQRYSRYGRRGSRPTRAQNASRDVRDVQLNQWSYAAAPVITTFSAGTW